MRDAIASADGLPLPRRTPRYVLALAFLVASFAVLTFSAASAFAERTYDSQITGFATPHGVTVDSSDHVWISDPGNGGKIFKYNGYPSQTLESTQTGGGHYGATYIWSLAVNSTSGYLYVADSGPETVDVFDPVNFVEQWSLGGGYDYAAIDNSGGASNGRVYVAKAAGGVFAFDPNHNAVNFSASEPYIAANNITGTPAGSFGRPWNIAVDSEGNIYVVDQNKKVVDEFKSRGEFVQEFSGAGAPTAFSGNLNGVAVDPTNGNVLVVDSGNKVVDEFSSSGEYLDQIAGISPSNPFGRLEGGIAVNSEGYVYIADGETGAVDIFTPNAVVPKVTYQPVSNETQTSGTLNATVDPNGGGEVTACQFEYGPTTSYGSSVPCSPATPYSTPNAVSADISGITPDIIYHYRVVAANAQPHGTKRGPDQTFTLHAVAGLSTDPATTIEATSAMLNGSFIGNGEDTHYHFEWGTTTSYGNNTPELPGADAGSPTGPGRTSVPPVHLTGLNPETTYHYQIVATNGIGTSHDEDQQFTTPPAVESLHTGAAMKVTATSATMTGSFVGNGEDTHYYFEYGATTSYGQTTPVPPGVDNGSGTGPQQASAVATGLNEGQPYHYRIVAINSHGETKGNDETFTTGLTPSIDGFFASDVTATTATLNAKINPNGQDTHYRFEYGETTAYGSTAPIPSGDAGSGNSDQTVSVQLSGLAIRTLYHFRVVAESEFGTVTSGDQSFSFFTPNCPNQTLRQQTGSNTLPDCRAYELVSPANMGNIILFPGVGPESSAPQANNEFAFGGGLGLIPGTGKPLNSLYIDTYVATRSDEGWTTKYVGFPGDQANYGALDATDLSMSLFIATDEDSSPQANAYCGGGRALFNASGEFVSCLVPPAAIRNDYLTGESAELNHFFYFNFNTQTLYDNSRTANSASNISFDPAGHPLAVEYGYEREVHSSADGSVIVFYSGGQLYVRVNDAATYALGGGGYAGMTTDGSTIIFGAGGQLQQWNGSTNTVTLVSTGASESPLAIGKANAAVLFYSPEQLDGTKGIYGQQNLYDFREGKTQFIGTNLGISPPNREYGTPSFNFSPDGGHMAFLSTTQDTANTNIAANGICSRDGVTGRPLTGPNCQEMYSWDATSGRIVCDSCDPHGAPPIGDTYGADHGLFMANDGRTFFYTPNPLVPQDTDELSDVYEYVGGRPQLITTGTLAEATQVTPNQSREAGLAAVSEDGTNVFFESYASLVGQDTNGSFLKYYDARAGGGFPFVPPAAPCAAADECHGPGSEPPTLTPNGTAASLSGGDVSRTTVSRHHKRAKRRKHKSTKYEPKSHHRR